MHRGRGIVKGVEEVVLVPGKKREAHHLCHMSLVGEGGTYCPDALELGRKDASADLQRAPLDK